MIHKKSLAIVIALITANMLYSKPVTPDRAILVAQNFWQQTTGQQARLLDVSAQTGFTKLYIFDVNQGKGYIVISANDVAYPVLAYSKQSGFGTSNIAPAVRELLNEYENHIAWALTFGNEATSEVAKEWQALESNTSAHTSAHKAVDQLLTTTWNQDAPYNNLCPADSAGNRSVTGCVATAMAQVMKYWEFPEHGIGTHSYSYEDRPIAVINMVGDSSARWTYGTLTVDYENTYYDWNNMPDHATTTSLPEEQEAVATLSYHCGVAVDMVYTPTGSGAFMTRAEVLGFDSINYSTEISAEVVIPQYFGYSPTTVGLMRDDYSIGEWLNLLKNELQNGRPIIYAGNSEGSDYGHAFVLDGYDAQYYFHCNFGWGGSYDGGFRLDEIAPTGGGLTMGYKQSGIFRMYPPGRGGSDENGITGNPHQKTDFTITGQNRTINIDGQNIGKGEVYDIAGHRVSNFNANGEQHIEIRVAKGGIFIVRTDNGSRKVFVR